MGYSHNKQKKEIQTRLSIINYINHYIIPISISKWYYELIILLEKQLITYPIIITPMALCVMILFFIFTVKKIGLNNNLQ